MSAFDINIKYISWGSCDLELHINDKVISCMPSYMGRNPLNSLVESCFYLFQNEEDDDDLHESSFSWNLEPQEIRFKLFHSKDKMLHIDIVKYDDYSNEPKNKINEWHEIVPFDDFKNAIIREAFRVLKQYGLYGYREAWLDNTEFPLSILLFIAGKTKSFIKDDSHVSSNLTEEIDFLSKL